MGRNFLTYFAVVIGTFLGNEPATLAKPNWELGESIPIIDGRPNPLELASDELREAVRQGKLLALEYPVESSITIPYRALSTFIESPATDPFRRVIQSVFWKASSLRSMDDFEKMVGLIPFPATEGSGAYYIPFKDGIRPNHRMGTTIIENPETSVSGITFSCAACHASQLFGRPVLGLQNRFPKAIDFFIQGRDVFRVVSPEVASSILGANAAEAAAMAALQKSTKSIDGVRPLTEGMDSSLAHVALSLSRRSPDPWATPAAEHQKKPRDNFLRHARADSKPGTWWNVKYKNRWLLDGSVVSGNPIFTNILWNEIGRGADLNILQDWLEKNSDKIDALTAMVFDAKAPKFVDFFDASEIDSVKAKQGKLLFDSNCARCHGRYDKAWEIEQNQSLPWAAQLVTTSVHYFSDTPVKDVGTDPSRWQGMEGLLGLNDLNISKRFGIVIEKQKGYVPPPLEGIWARWPYMHNNSIPNLCAVLTKAADRPQTYYAGEAIDRETDFDRKCVGYPVGNIPRNWRKKSRLYDTKRPAMGNGGHDEGIFLRDGEEIYSFQQKMSIIEFLKTL